MGDDAVSENQTNPAAQIAQGQAKPVFSDASWEKRLNAARAKREKVLSSRSFAKKGKVLLAGKRKPAQQPNPVLAARPKTREFGFRLTGSDAVKALLIFAGGVGLGLGAVLGIGILIGLGTTVDRQAVQVAGLTSPNVQTQTPPEIIEEPLAPLHSVLPAATETEGTIARQPNAAPSTVLTASLEQADLPRPPHAIPAYTRLSYVVPEGAPDSVQAGRVLSQPIASPASDLPALPAVQRYFIHAPTGVSDATVQRYVGLVETSGVDIAAIGREAFRVSSTHLRYYGADTKPAAMALAADLGVEARDFSQNAQVPGRIEIWLAGRPKEVSTAPIATVQEPEQRRFQLFRRAADNR